jgi:hypothetical protein
MDAGTSKSEWQKHERVLVGASRSGLVYANQLLPPYGDDPRDQFWIKLGYQYYNSHKK